MKRAMCFLADMVLGAFYGCIVGLFIYIALLFVTVGILKGQSRAKSISFEIGLAFVPLLAILKIWEGQKKPAKTEGAPLGNERKAGS